MFHNFVGSARQSCVSATSLIDCGRRMGRPRQDTGDRCSGDVPRSLDDLHLGGHLRHQHAGTLGADGPRRSLHCRDRLQYVETEGSRDEMVKTCLTRVSPVLRTGLVHTGRIWLGCVTVFTESGGWSRFFLQIKTSSFIQWIKKAL